jgi:hypothetical protein
MKKWPIIALMAVLLAAYGIFLLFWFGQERPAPEPPAVSTQASSQPQVIPVVDTEPAETEPSVTAETDDPALMTQPAEPVLPPDETLLRAKHVFVYDLTNERLMYTMGDQQEQIALGTDLSYCHVSRGHFRCRRATHLQESVFYSDLTIRKAHLQYSLRQDLSCCLLGSVFSTRKDQD